MRESLMSGTQSTQWPKRSESQKAVNEKLPTITLCVQCLRFNIFAPVLLLSYIKYSHSQKNPKTAVWSLFPFLWTDFALWRWRQKKHWHGLNFFVVLLKNVSVWLPWRWKWEVRRPWGASALTEVPGLVRVRVWSAHQRLISCKMQAFDDSRIKRRQCH